MTIIANCLLRSKHASTAKELLTFECYYPRAMLHEELLTHRSLSRNAASSRATTVNNMVDQVKNDPALPERWGLSGRGMVDAGIMTDAGAAMALKVFLAARDDMVRRAGEMLKLNEKPHKQIINIMLRPWEHITTIISGTEWTNFFALRRHPDARPEMKMLADAMWDAYKAAPIQVLEPGQWHLPYVQQHEIDALEISKDKEQALANLIALSAARCARTSYKNQNGKVVTFQDDMDLYGRLMGGSIKHASPTEHQATPDDFKMTFNSTTKKLTRHWDHPELHGNFVGFQQNRKMIPGENITIYNPEN